MNDQQDLSGIWTERVEAVDASPTTHDDAGFTLAVKANIAVAGLHRTAGSRALGREASPVDAPVVAVLRAAGARIVGAANMHELAFGITSANAASGDVPNPAAPGRSAGGSSGGSAAAVAAGLADAALGTDTGGSMTIPASHCGVVGFRPSTGRWPTAGAVGLSWTRDTTGVFARTVERVARIDELVTQTSGGALDGRPRLGVATGLCDDLDPITRSAFEAALDRLSGVAEIVQFSSHQIWELARSTEMPVVLWESRELLSQVAAQEWGTDPEDGLRRLAEGSLSPDVRGLMELLLTRPTSDDDYAAAQDDALRARALHAAAFAEAGLDAAVFPTTPAPAPPIAVGGTVGHLGREADTFGLYTRNTGPGSMLGVPAVSVPCVPVADVAATSAAPSSATPSSAAASSSDGAGPVLPVGFSVQGARFGDRRLLAVARIVQEALEG